MSNHLRRQRALIVQENDTWQHRQTNEEGSLQQTPTYTLAAGGQGEKGLGKAKRKDSGVSKMAQGRESFCTKY